MNVLFPDNPNVPPQKSNETKKVEEKSSTTDVRVVQLAKNAMKEGVVKPIDNVSASAEVVDARIIKLAHMINKKYLVLQALIDKGIITKADLFQLAPYLTHANCNGLILTAEEYQRFIGRLTQVKSLFLDSDQIEHLTVPQSVEDLECWCPKLAKLDISKNDKLKMLYCCDLAIVELELPLNLETVGLSYCANLLWVKVPKYGALKHFVCTDCPIRNLELSKNLESVRCIDCRQFINLDLSKYFRLKSLELEGGTVRKIVVPSSVQSMLLVGCDDLTDVQFSEDSALEQFCVEGGANLVEIRGRILPKCALFNCKNCPKLEKTPLRPLELVGKINSDNFPLQALIDNGSITEDDLELLAPNLTYVNCSGLKLSDEKMQKFIGQLTHAKVLIVDSDQIRNLTVPRCVEHLECSCPALLKLEIARDSNLKTLICNCPIQELIIPDNLNQLVLRGCNILKLQIPKESKLKSLFCSNCLIEELEVLGDLESLTCTTCENLKILRIAENSKLKNLELEDCPNLSVITCKSLPNCVFLSYENCPKLEKLPELPLQK